MPIGVYERVAGNLRGRVGRKRLCGCCLPGCRICTNRANVTRLQHQYRNRDRERCEGKEVSNSELERRMVQYFKDKGWD